MLGILLRAWADVKQVLGVGLPWQSPERPSPAEVPPGISGVTGPVEVPLGTDIQEKLSRTLAPAVVGGVGVALAAAEAGLSIKSYLVSKVS
jgi:hypothetical protein